ncbi:hypothetical protein BaRGS_00018071 [Batillaria attramentaria]|uniref:DEP domain-containing protein n=1 Tax=Batillaria attramentaria TaxID=370345 RepID=A0ABD0KTV2_9CAEN
MSLNLFENYYLDRNFDRTGKVSVVITPGPGVFEVDRELTFITKQRTIDCGVGSDLVCMGEQPLHAVPLFKFRSRNVQSSVEVGDDYNIPHWMNHSFYTSKNQIQRQQNAKFVPRIKPPPEFLKMMEKNPPKLGDTATPFRVEGSGDDGNFPFVDYDEYDAQVFKLPSRTYNRSLRSVSCFGLKGASAGRRLPRTFAEARQMVGPRTRHVSDEPVGAVRDSPSKKANMSSSAIAIPATHSTMEDMSYSVGCYPIRERCMSRESFESSGSEDTSYQRPVVGSAGSPIGHSRLGGGYHLKRALINPFAPSRLQFKMTSNRRRWVHALPTDAKGATVQPHHVQMSMSSGSQEADDYMRSTPTPEVVQAAQLAVEARRHKSSISHGGLSEAEGVEAEVVSAAVLRSVSSTNSTGSRPSSSAELGLQRSLSSMQRLFHKGEKYIPWAQTGEQAWNPDLTTGWDWRPLDQREASAIESRLVKPIFTPTFESDNFCSGISVDWKSLTVPASLPITTDYFPDERSLKYDYVLADYSLLPDDVNADYWMSPPDDKNLSFYRRSPLTTLEVFRELISQFGTGSSQQSSHGFQWIISKKHASKVQAAASASKPQYQHTKGLIRARDREPEEEYYLSIGRIFHKLKLRGPTITVTRYWPRFRAKASTTPAQLLQYRYRFQAPDSYCYDSSSTEFFNECLETYNWNYLDQYICTRGESDYGLTESLKYWRSRYFLLPSFNAATKKINEGQSTRCDIYEEKSASELKQQIANFVRFLEIINKLKRSPQARRSKGQQGLPSNCFISAEAVIWCQQSIAGVQSIAQATQLMQRLIDEGMILHASGNPRHKFIYGFYLYYVTQSKGKPDFQGHLIVPGSTYNTLFQNEWLEVSFLPGAADDEGGDVEKAEKVDKFYLPSPSASPPRGDSVLLMSPTVVDDWRDQTGLSKQGWGQQSATLLHKYVNVDVNAAGKSERQEWATARYNAYYSPLCAFELQLQWMVATGCVLGDLLLVTVSTEVQYSAVLSSDSIHCGGEIPVDPFALPNCVNSDPLRGPIFVPLAISTVDEGDSIFSDCAEETKQDRLLRIQDAILKRYGFVPITVTLPVTARPQPSLSLPSFLSKMEVADYKHQYVHCTVGMFVLIPELKASPNSSPAASASIRHPPSPTVTSYLSKRSSSDLHKDYIARQHSNRKFESNDRIGFLWSWNYMSSKRWRSANTGFEDFQDKMLADFREFCQNKDNRLDDFLKEGGFRF